MTVLLQVLSGVGATAIAPFLIQLIKKKAWKGIKAKRLAVLISFAIAVGWVLLSGVIGPSEGVIGTIEWFAWLLGAATAVFASATLIYRWFEDNVFKKIKILNLW